MNPDVHCVAYVNRLLCCYLHPRKTLEHAWNSGILHTIHHKLSRYIVSSSSLIIECVINQFSDHIRCGAYCSRCTVDALHVAHALPVVASVWHNAGLRRITSSATHFRQFLEYVIGRMQEQYSNPEILDSILTFAPIWYHINVALQQIVSQDDLNVYNMSWRHNIHTTDMQRQYINDMSDFEYYIRTQYTHDLALVEKHHIPTLRIVTLCHEVGQCKIIHPSHQHPCLFLPPRSRCVIYEDVPGGVYYVLDRNVFNLIEYFRDVLHVDVILVIWSYLHFDTMLRQSLILWIHHMYNDTFLADRQCAFT